MRMLLSFKTIGLSALSLLCVYLSSGQDTIPTPAAVDTTNIMVMDTTVVDTIVIRKTQEQVRHITKGVDLAKPVVSFKKTKALQDKYNRFRIPSFWSQENTFGINLSEVAFVNWNAGGNNAVSGLGFLQFKRNYKFRYFQWDNNLDLRYGLNAQEGKELRKTEDVIRLNSNLGYRRDTISNWYYSVQVNFNTQFSNGYKYPNTDTPISRFMAPGYFFAGAGTSYISQNQKFNLYLSPATQKATFVLDQRLADNGAFGVRRAIRDADGNIIIQGENSFIEFGFLITNNYDWQVTENINVRSRLNLYTDYLASFGNIDVDWELNIRLRVNKYIQTTIGTHLIYDDDILFDVVRDASGNITDAGSQRIQFKQTLGVGVAYDF